MKKLLVTVLAAGMIMLIAVPAFAAETSTNYDSPAEAVAGLTGRTVESVTAERLESGKTYGSIASEAGVLEEFKAASLKMIKDNLATQVKKGNLTQSEADTIIAAIEANQAICDGTGTAKTGQENGRGFGCGAAERGTGFDRGEGRGRGMGKGGMRLQNGSCYKAE